VSATAEAAMAETATAGATAQAVVPGETFQNPVLRANFPDPGVINVDGTYYAYATNGSGRNVQLAISNDLVSWTVKSDAMPALPRWVKLSPSDVWAPEVIRIGEKYLLYYTARDKASGKQCVGVAVSDKPEGKFRDTSDKPLVCQTKEGGTIDASPFLDGDKLYLYFKNDGNCCGFTTYLYVQELAPDGLSLLGEPVRLVRNDKTWEGRVVEAPTMWKQDDAYYLFYSGNDYSGIPYAVGYATCEGPLGPCQDSPDNPILESALKRPPVIGPGHQTIVLDDDGEQWMVYHAWEVTSQGVKTDRRLMWIDRLVWEDGKPKVQGPTTEVQVVP
jgi:beta-xylosidase